MAPTPTGVAMMIVMSLGTLIAEEFVQRAKVLITGYAGVLTTTLATIIVISEWIWAC
jgi:hypothetical protein